VVALERETVYELPPEMASDTVKVDIAGTTVPEFELMTEKVPDDDGERPLKADWTLDVTMETVTTALGFSDPSDSEFKETVTPVFQSAGEIVTFTGDTYLVADTPLPEAVKRVAYVDV